MQAFETLTAQGQLRRIRKLAETAVKEFGLNDATLTFINHGENTTYRVDDRAQTSQPVSAVYAPNRYLLRVHNPNYNTPAEIESEMIWLATLREHGLSVPEPVKSKADTFTLQIEVAGMAGSRTCTLMRWMRGSIQFHHTKPQHVQQLGMLMAKLHQHAQTWQPPSNFTRRRWDWDGIFGPNTHFSSPVVELMQRIPVEHRPAIERVIQRYQQVLSEIGESPATFGLIHADLHLWNVLFAGGEARAIDFDDCGYGYWLYDICVAIGQWWKTPQRDEMLGAFIQGYETHLPFPHQHQHLMADILLTRQVMVLLWVIAKGIHDPAFQGYEQQRLDYVLSLLATN